jgi:hypothetical protein
MRMTRAQISDTIADEIQRLVDRPLPRSASLLGAEQPVDEDSELAARLNWNERWSGQT